MFCQARCYPWTYWMGYSFKYQGAITSPKSMTDVVTPRSAKISFPPCTLRVSAIPLRVALPPALPSLGQVRRHVPGPLLEMGDRAGRKDRQERGR